MWLRISLIILCLPLSGFAFGSDSISRPTLKNIEISGYLKDLRLFAFDAKGTVTNTSFLHQRFKVTAHLNSRLKLRTEMRTRVFYGNIPNSKVLPELLNADPGFTDLSWVPVSNPALIWNTNIDRLYLNWNHDHWDITLGRQRVNWGMNLVWNPNDLFNTLNYTDFDYEERPGSDALRIQYYRGMNSLELAVSPHMNLDSSVAAVLVKSNYKGYDFQAIGGYYRGEAILGAGWAGNLKNVGFKGECSWFSGNHQTDALWMASPSFDYTFRNDIFASMSFLYKSKNTSAQLMLNNTLLSGNLDVKSLMPNRYSAFAQLSGSFNPILGGNIGAIYAIDLNTIFLMPGITWSVKDNFEILLLAQSFISLQASPGFHAIFVRLKWNF